MEAKTRSGRPGTVHGDQGLLIHRADFDALGGYREQLPYFEDVYLSDAIFRSARWELLPDALHTSARRFVREGVRQRYALMAVMMISVTATASTPLTEAACRIAMMFVI